MRARRRPTARSSNPFPRPVVLACVSGGLERLFPRLLSRPELTRHGWTNRRPTKPEHSGISGGFLGAGRLNRWYIRRMPDGSYPTPKHGYIQGTRTLVVARTQEQARRVMPWHEDKAGASYQSMRSGFWGLVLWYDDSAGVSCSGSSAAD